MKIWPHPCSRALQRFLLHIWRQWLRPVALVILITMPLRSAIVDWNWVPTGSMKPTIMEGDLVLVNKLAYDLKLPFTTRHILEWAEPVRGDVAVFFSPSDGIRLVKRVIGLPGDTIELRNEVLYINGSPQKYSACDAQKFLRDIHESKKPLLAIEHLGDEPCDHYIMVLPERPAMRDFGPLTVPPNHYFMMGDSRDNSMDSRFFGAVPRQQIIGRAANVIVSLDPSRLYLPRFSRITLPLRSTAQ